MTWPALTLELDRRFVQDGIAEVFPVPVLTCVSVPAALAGVCLIAGNRQQLVHELRVVGRVRHRLDAARAVEAPRDTSHDHTPGGLFPRIGPVCSVQWDCLGRIGRVGQA